MTKTQEGNQELITKYIFYGGILFLIISLFFGCFYTISAGERGIVLMFGKPNMEAAGEGLHLKWPIIQSVKKLEVRTTKLEVSADAASKDLQDVQTTIALNYHLSPEETPKLYQEIGAAYKERIIDPAIQESVKSVTAKFTAEELITRRPEVRAGIQEALKERLSKYYIMVDDFNIVNFQFSEEFDKAIEEKVTAEQKKLKAERDLERIKIEKEQKITQAQAEAEALRLQKQEITEDLIKLRQIEVQSKALDIQLEAINKWNGVLPSVTGNNVPLIGIEGLELSQTTTAQ